MSQASVNFVFGALALGQAAQGSDFIRGLIGYGTAPGSFATTSAQATFSLPDAVAKGIANDYADETQPIATIAITTKGNTGDTMIVSVTEPYANGVTTVVPICIYTVGSSDTTIALQQTALTAAINATSYATGVNGFTGYTSVATATTSTVVGRVGIGISLNTGSPLNVSITGAFVESTTQFSAGTIGVYSKKSLWYYHTSEFFRESPTGILWWYFTATPNVGGVYSEITTLQSASQGASKVIGIYNTVARSAAQFVSDMGLQNAQAAALLLAYQPSNIFYAPNIKAVSDLSTLVNGQANTYQYCSPCIGQDGGAAGADLFVRTGVSVSCIGNMLGVSSAAAVSQDIGENTFNVSNGSELNIPAFSNGQLYSALAAPLITQIDSYHYIFLKTYTNFSGTYYNDDWTFTSNTSDYNRISRNLTMQKVVRVLYAALLPLLKARIYLNKDGTMTQVTMQKYLDPSNTAVGQLQKDGDISNFSISLPSQNVLSTGKVVETVKIQPVGIAEFIEVDLSFAQTV